MKSKNLLLSALVLVASCGLVCAFASTAFADGYSPDYNFNVDKTDGTVGEGAYLIFSGNPDDVIVVPAVYVDEDAVTHPVVSFVCKDFQAKSIDLSQATNLKYLDCSNNLFQTLDISACTELEYLDCSNNLLSSLDISNNTKLTTVKAYRNNIANTADLNTWGSASGHELSVQPMNTLPSEFSAIIPTGSSVTVVHLNINGTSTDVVMPKAYVQGGVIYSIQQLTAVNKNISSIDLSALDSNFKTLNVNNNNLTSLDVSMLTELKDLQCSYNKLTSLDISKNSRLTNLECDNNYITNTAKLESWLVKSGHTGKVLDQIDPNPTVDPEPEVDNSFDAIPWIVGGILLLIIAGGVGLIVTRNKKMD